jgi:hypothetical protein
LFRALPIFINSAQEEAFFVSYGSFFSSPSGQTTMFASYGSMVDSPQPFRRFTMLFVVGVVALVCLWLGWAFVTGDLERLL